VNLAHDVLDKQLVDCNGRNIGKVDGLILELPQGKPPRVLCIEVGAVTLANRFSRRLGKLVAKIYKRVPEAGSYRIPWSKIRDLGVDIQVEIDSEKAPPLTFERWLSKHIIRRIPGG